MNGLDRLLLDRATGNIGLNAFARYTHTQLICSFRATPRFTFDGGGRVHDDNGQAGTWSAGIQAPTPAGNASTNIRAHHTGVNALALERFDGKLLVSGGADGTLKIWDLEQCPNPTSTHTYRPAGEARRFDERTPSNHRFGITHLCFYPFDSAAFLSSSYDQTLKLWATEGARLSGSFGLGAKVYTHAMSPVASHLLVACATQHPAIRLIDLRSSAAVQSLISPGQVGAFAGANMAVAWSPVYPHVLASGSADGAVRIWDVRRANGLIGLLDQEDSLGITWIGRSQPADSTGASAPALEALRARNIRTTAKAHDGAVNGLTWTDDGLHIISTGHDGKIRVWDAASGANTLVSFGPSVRNMHPSTLTMFTTPTGLAAPGRELLFYPNETEVLVMNLHDGSLVSRLRAPGPQHTTMRLQYGSERTVRNRVTSMAWRGAGGGGSSSGLAMGGATAPGGLYSGHSDGQIRAWLPSLGGFEEEEEDAVHVSAARTRKRRAIDNAYRSLMGKQIREG